MNRQPAQPSLTKILGSSLGVCIMSFPLFAVLAVACALYAQDRIKLKPVMLPPDHAARSPVTAPTIENSGVPTRDRADAAGVQPEQRD